MQSIMRWGFGAIAAAALAMAWPGQTVAGQTRPCLPNCGNVQPQVYRAELKTTNVQTLADGTTITNEGKQVYARDSQGRTLTALTGYPYFAMPNQSEVTRVTVTDPVENTRSNWDSRTKKATVIKEPPQDQRHGCWVTDSGNLRMSFASDGPTARPPPSLPALPPPPASKNLTQEDLGTQSIMGVEAHGYRTTTTIPVGEMGNHKPLRRVDEYWSAPGFPFSMRQVGSDPQSGTRTTELVSMDLSEPDPATFLPPEGYAVVVEELHETACREMVP